MKTCLWLNAATSFIWSFRSMPLPNTSPLMSPTPATRIDVLRMSIPISRKCRSTFVQPPRDVMPIALWS